MRIVPEHLIFKTPLNEQSTEYIKLENDGDSRIIFKVRTSAPTRYCVRPNVAVIGAHESVKVQIVFLGSTAEHEMRQKQDKFLIVTLPIPAACADMKEKELLSNWSSLEEQYKADAIFKKIKVFHSAIRKQRPSKSQGSKSSRRVSSSPDNEQCLSSTTLLVMALIALLVGWLYY
ncbi:hypothetical protein SKDZ_02G0170 [Saccharomyces kudriavzevii ZP591]|nr:hypothetical protein SKDZ_02G0170 [Saccharomyces kudriavzevii ZP591]